MGLISCPECGEKISHRAGACPKCGVNPQLFKADGRLKPPPLTFGALMGICIIFSLVWALYDTIHNATPNDQANPPTAYHP